MSTVIHDDNTSDEGGTSSRDRLIVALWSLVLSVVIFAPLLGSRGGVLRGDLLFSPHDPIKGAWLGFDGSAPHGVPYDFVLSLVTTIVPGDLVQKALLLLVLLIAGTGAAAAVSRWGLPAQLVAATFFVWNPFVYERLAAGDLRLLFGYAALGWVAWAGARATGTTLLGVGPMIIALALAGWTSPTGGVIAALVALGAVAHRGIRTLLLTLAASILVDLPWIIPGLLHPGGVLPESTGVAAYSASPDTKLGVLGSLLTLGGIWDPSSVAPGRDNAIIATITLVVTIIGIAGLALAWGRASRGPLTGLTVVAVLGLLVALLGAYGGTRTVIDSIAENVPGGVLLRDGHAWLAPFALLLAIGWAGAVKFAADRGSNVLVALATVVGIAVPIALLPGLALALDHELKNDNYPADWWKARGILASKDRSAIAVLPLGGYRDFTWTDSGQVADPAPHFFLGDVVVDDSRTVNGTVVPSDSKRASALRTAMEKPKAAVPLLLAMGIDTVVVERDTQTDPIALTGQDVEKVFDGHHLAVYELSGDVGAKKDGSTPAIPIIIGDIIALALVLVGVGIAIADRTRRPRTANDAPRSRPRETSAFARPAPAPVPPTYTELPPPAPVTGAATPVQGAVDAPDATEQFVVEDPTVVVDPLAPPAEPLVITETVEPAGGADVPTETYAPFDQPADPDAGQSDAGPGEGDQPPRR